MIKNEILTEELLRLKTPLKSGKIILSMEIVYILRNCLGSVQKFQLTPSQLWWPYLITMEVWRGTLFIL